MVLSLFLPFSRDNYGFLLKDARSLGSRRCEAEGKVAHNVGKYKLYIDMVILELCSTASWYGKDRAMAISVNYLSDVTG